MSVATTSLAAYKTLDLPELERKTLEAIASFGSHGCTQDDILEAYPDFVNETLTPRFAPLERKGLMYRAGDTRAGKSGRQQKVMRTTEWIEHVPIISAPKKLNPYLKGFVDAARIACNSKDLEEAKKAMQVAIRKAIKA